MQYHGVFTIGQKENFRYNYFISLKRSVLSGLIVFALILLLNAFLRFSYGMSPTFAAALLYALPLALGGAALLQLLNLGFIYLRVGSLYKQKKLAPFTQDVLMDKSGIHASSERGSVDLPWKNVGLVRENRKDFLIFITDTHAYVLPKDQMKNPAVDVDTIRKILHKNMDAPRLKLKG